VGEKWITSQFDFDPAALIYLQTHYIHLDHEQLASGSAGITYKWGYTVFSTDVLYGTGLREDSTATDGSTIPNCAHVPPYGTVNLGVSHDFTDIGWNGVKARFDVINVFDIDYQIRSGTGVGVRQRPGVVSALAIAVTQPMSAFRQKRTAVKRLIDSEKPPFLIDQSSEQQRDQRHPAQIEWQAAGPAPGNDQCYQRSG
jgi:hypothetical protein